MSDDGITALDDEQADAAYSDPTVPLLLLSSAGGGKTRTLVMRLLHLLASREDGAFGDRSWGAVTALTHTRNAKRVIERRVAHASEVTGQDTAALDVRTFHSFALDLYREGWARDYDNLAKVTIAGDSLTLQLMVDAAADVGLDEEPVLIHDLVTDYKMGRRVNKHLAATVRGVVRRYDELLADREMIDRADIIIRPVRLLRELEVLRDQVRARVAAVVSDESQDWTPYHAALFLYACGPEGLGTLAGDPNQAIYSDASPAYLTHFLDVFPAASVKNLQACYRLPGPIFDLSRAVADEIAGGGVIGYAVNPYGHLPVIKVAQSYMEQAAWIAAELQRLRGQRELANWSDAVILVRTRKQRPRIVQALREHGFASVSSGARTLGKRPAVRALLAWLTLLRDPDDRAALMTALTMPPRGVQNTEPRSLHTALEATGTWTLAMLAQSPPPGLSEWQRRELDAFVSQVRGFARVLTEEGPVAALDAVLERAGLEHYLRRRFGARCTADIATLRQLVAHEGDLGALDQILSEEAAEAEDNVVGVRTLHESKGMESPVVFMIDLDEDVFPLRAAVEEGAEGLQAEWRLFYVGVTRALRRLYLTSGCQGGRPHTQGRPSRMVRRLRQTAADLIEIA